MRWFHRLIMRMRMLFGRGRAADHLDAELRFHLDREIAENLARGLSAQEARLAALGAFGNPALLRDQAHATWSWAALESVLRDLRYGMRTLWRSPGFAAIAILVMSLGIGANVALFTVVRGVLLQPLPYRNPGRLIAVYQRDSTSHDARHPYLPIDAGSFKEWQQAAQGMAEMALVSPFQDYNVSAEGGKLPEKIAAAWCSWNFFSVLGIQPALGRSFAASDDHEGAPATTIIAYGFWKRRYGGDPAVIGKTIWLDARPYTVIGVLPENFFYSTSIFGGNNVQAWTPVNREAPPALMREFGDHEFITAVRLMPGVTQAALVGKLDALQAHIHASQSAPSVHDGVLGISMLDDAVESYKTPLYALLAATACLLLIACMNVAGLLVARAAARTRELAIRTALGGGRLRLLRERLIESFLLSGAGGALGLLMAWTAVQWLIRARADMNRVQTLHVDWVVAAFTVAAVALCALSAGLVSALSAGSGILGALQEGSRAHSGSAARARLRKILLALEVGLTVVLLVGAGLLLKSFHNLRSTDIGVPEENVLTMHISLPEARYKTDVQQVAFFEELIGRVRAIPGVKAAGLASQVPGEGWGGDQMMEVVEHPPMPKGRVPDMMTRGADPGFFAAIRLPLLRGRVFTSDERLGRANVVVISQSAARVLFPGEDPIGKHLRGRDEGASATSFEVVGVVADSRWHIAVPPQPTVYWPIFGNDFSVAKIVVRSANNVESLAIPVERVIAQLDPDLPVSDVMTLSEAIGKSTIGAQFDSILVMAFAVIAVLLAAAGLYGVLSYLVAQRTGEIGIRIALGAKREQVLRLMLLDGLRPALFGLVLGLAGSVAVVRQIKSMLYETKPLDPIVFAAAAAMLMVVAAIACIAPAWRASRLDPMQALRTE